MSKKEVKQEETVQETQEVTPMQFGVAPFVAVMVVRENRVYRFEMPVGAKLDECVEASEECIKIVMKMRDDANEKAKAAEEDEKAEKQEEVPEE